MRNLGPVRVSCEVLTGHPAYGVLLGDAALAGRCPVWISERGLRSLDVPADQGAVLAEIGCRSAADVLAEQWPHNYPVERGGRPPFEGPFPGLVAAPDPVDDAVATAKRFAADESWPSHLAVVPVSRPADIVAVVGWLGTINYHRDVTGLSAVLRSWEDRFGAMVVRMDLATLWLSVAAPPRSVQECLGVAVEHFAFCRDVDGEDPRPLRQYAATLAGRQVWRFWWD
jgi:hypothetical protein